MKLHFSPNKTKFTQETPAAPSNVQSSADISSFIDDDISMFVDLPCVSIDSKVCRLIFGWHSFEDIRTINVPFDLDIELFFWTLSWKSFFGIELRDSLRFFDDVRFFYNQQTDKTSLKTNEPFGNELKFQLRDVSKCTRGIALFSYN